MFSAAPALAVADKVKVTGLGAPFDGTVDIVSQTANTVTYTSPTVNTAFNTITTNTAMVTNTIARLQVINSVTETRTYPVTPTDLIHTGGNEAFNVPGSIIYDSANAIDNIIIANESGTTSAN